MTRATCKPLTVKRGVKSGKRALGGQGPPLPHLIETPRPVQKCKRPMETSAQHKAPSRSALARKETRACLALGGPPSLGDRRPRGPGDADAHTPSQPLGPGARRPTRPAAFQTCAQLAAAVPKPFFSMPNNLLSLIQPFSYRAIVLRLLAILSSFICVPIWLNFFQNFSEMR